ncbi:MAG: ankyrin repeat domain-containing protein, partial [Truepera sp.]|nr:ankyrin repeat domain-containing protein [Truepera sp.]
MRCLLVWGVLSLAAQAVAAGCAEWNTREFFESATLEQLEGCLDAGAEVNARDGGGFTPLHNAAGWSANPAIIETLVAAGVEVNVRGRVNFTPLHNAAWWNANPAVIEALVAAGAEVNARDRDGDTPLHDAARFSDNPAIITALLDAGADEAARDDDGKIPWDYARNRAQLKDPDAWRLNGLSPVAQESAADPESRSLCARWNTLDFFEAATLEQVVECLAAEAGVNARDEYGRTPLHNAALVSTDPAVIAALLDAGAGAVARDDEGRIPWDYVKERDALRSPDAWRLNGLSLATQVFAECARWNTLD